jgi:hypothetical protein
MIGFLLNFLGRVLIGALFFGLTFLLINFMAVVRLLPYLLVGVRRIVRNLVILSYRFYRMTFIRLQPMIQNQLGIDVLNGPARLILCILFSLALGSLALIFVDLSTGIWIIGISFLHGLFVGLAWDDIENPGGVQLGVER